jgi:hypothetical protein
MLDEFEHYSEVLDVVGFVQLARRSVTHYALASSLLRGGTPTMCPFAACSGASAIPSK